MYSDESEPKVSFANGRLRVWRQTGERFDDACVVEYYRWAGGSVHVWGGITAFNKTQLVVLNGHLYAKSYINNVLRSVGVPFTQPHPPRGIYQQDNARAHTAGASIIF